MNLVGLMTPGDILVYNGSGFFSWLIRVNSNGYPITHVEVYIGNRQSIGARVSGVDVYEVSTDGLVGIYRPVSGSLNMDAGMKWFNERCKGQYYDWWAIVGFSRIITAMGEGPRKWLQKKGQNMSMCIELVARWFRKAGCDLFPGADADALEPYQIVTCPSLHAVYRTWKR